MTTLPESKHEALARACAELVGDEVDREGATVPVVYTSEGELELESYISCKNLAGRVLDAVRPIFLEQSTGSFQLASAMGFLDDVWAKALYDTPQALWDIMKAANLLGDDA